MNYLKKYTKIHPGIILASLFLLLAPLNAFAQGRMQSPEQMKEQGQTQINQVLEHLALSDEKTESVRGILTRQLEARIASRESLAGNRNRDSRSKMRDEMEAQRESTHQELAEVLTEEEMNRYKSFVEENRPRGNRRGNRNSN